MAERVWTARRKWMGNVLPLLCTAPALVFAGFNFYSMRNPFDIGGVLGLLLAIPSALIGLNWFGMAGNRTMQRLMERKLLNVGFDLNVPRFFVGAATPSHVNALDAHEDVGFLVLEKDRLRFLGEKLSFQLPKATLQDFRLAPNVHTLLGLGGWIAISGTLDGKPIRLNIEPRTHATMLQNKRDRRRILAALKQWKTGP